MNNAQKESGDVKLCAIYNVWSDAIDLLEHSLSNILKSVDGVIVVWSEVSNYGEYDASIRMFSQFYPDKRVKFYQCEPKTGAQPPDNERSKRNFGLQKARQSGYTHFIMMDSDEFYHEDDVRQAIKKFNNPNLLGIVCKSQVYFGKPTLTIGLDVTLVPFIHKITDSLRFEWNRDYPFAWTKEPNSPRKTIRIDPTRQLNITSGVELSDIIMHHYSWVRKDPVVKVRNSSARVNIQNSTVLQDYLEAKEGYLCQFYNKELARCPNVFGLPE